MVSLSFQYYNEMITNTAYNFLFLFQEYKLANMIEASETYTVFAPHNDAITTYIRSKGQSTLVCIEFI